MNCTECQRQDLSIITSWIAVTCVCSTWLAVLANLTIIQRAQSLYMELLFDIWSTNLATIVASKA